MTHWWLFPPANAPSGLGEKFVKNQTGWLLYSFSADSYHLCLGGHIKAKRKGWRSLNHSHSIQKTNKEKKNTLTELPVFNRLFSASFHKKICPKNKSKTLCLHVELLIELKLYALPFTNIPSLVENYVQLWMNTFNFRAAVYFGFCSLGWLASTERQTNSLGVVDNVFLFQTRKKQQLLIKHSQPLQRGFATILIQRFIQRNRMQETTSQKSLRMPPAPLLVEIKL